MDVGLEYSDSENFLNNVEKTYNKVEEVFTVTLGAEDATGDGVKLQRLKK